MVVITKKSREVIRLNRRVIDIVRSLVPGRLTLRYHPTHRVSVVVAYSESGIEAITSGYTTSAIINGVEGEVRIPRKESLFEIDIIATI